MGDRALDELTSMLRPLASQMAGIAELGDASNTIVQVLHAHRRQLVPYAAWPVCLCPEHGGVSARWPCGTFTNAAILLRLLELFDGSRFSDTWPGPVEERRW